MPLTPYYDHAGCTIYHGDCLEILPALGPVDAVVADPPYGITHRANVKSKRGSIPVLAQYHATVTGDGVPFDPSPLLSVGCQHILWGANHYASRLPDSAGWLVWLKQADPFIGRLTFSDCELAWSNVGGAARVFKLIWGGIMRQGEGSLGRAGRRLHPTQKPVELMRWCIEKTKGLILDPYMGSGTTLRAAKDLGRKAIGIEIEERYCEIAAKRLAQEVLPLEVAANG
jgi:DNA modification methylase